ncbi:MAG: hypothetical protein CBB68_15360 [Rhodospirillaceae bacterium TMED8]|nr:hypothetical protein [Magnetovibrio sp.]OUT47801.1 MAG: hypothetical protein CBB68_15360 [Rhodospirillaceae bacterium TMED8]|tara:strand:+ start:620 stop:1375 length:756 start_codon:yes stop_codon:yes gene_type:complete
MKFKKRLLNPNNKLFLEICVIPSPVVTQALAAAGADAIIVDQEHGAVSSDKLHSMIAATAGTNCAPLVRVAERRPEYVKVALDLGAEGVVFPLIKNVQDAQSCVSMLDYPPKGSRGWGPFIAHSRWSVDLLDYKKAYGEGCVCILLIETIEAVQNIYDICEVDGVDAVFVAKFDLSTALGVSGQFDHIDFISAITRIEDAAKKTKTPLGGGPVRDKVEFNEYCKRGYQLFANFDVLRLKQSVHENLSWRNF